MLLQPGVTRRSSAIRPSAAVAAQLVSGTAPHCAAAPQCAAAQVRCHCTRRSITLRTCAPLRAPPRNTGHAGVGELDEAAVSAFIHSISRHVHVPHSEEQLLASTGLDRSAWRAMAELNALMTHHHAAITSDLLVGLSCFTTQVRRELLGAAARVAADRHAHAKHPAPSNLAPPARWRSRARRSGSVTRSRRACRARWRPRPHKSSWRTRSSS